VNRIGPPLFEQFQHCIEARVRDLSAMIVPYVVADIFRLTIEPICGPLVVKHYSSSPVENRHPYPGLVEQSVSPLAERPTWQHALLLYFWQLLFHDFLLVGLFKFKERFHLNSHVERKPPTPIATRACSPASPST
jgi:hypothetical protein